jgi:hypothetical protein
MTAAGSKDDPLRRRRDILPFRPALKLGFEKYLLFSTGWIIISLAEVFLIRGLDAHWYIGPIMKPIKEMSAAWRGFE